MNKFNNCFMNARQRIEDAGLRRTVEMVFLSPLEEYRECLICIYTRLKAIVGFGTFFVWND